jgi:hypothetical protein
MGRQDAIVFKDGFIALNAGIGVPVASGGHGGRGTERSRGGGEMYGAIWEEDGQSRGLVVTLSFFFAREARSNGSWAIAFGRPILSTRGSGHEGSTVVRSCRVGLA